MTQAAMNNAIVLYDLSVSREDVEKAYEIYTEEDLLAEVLENPVVSISDKHRLVERVFTEEEFPLMFINFMKFMCDQREIDELTDIFRAYYDYWDVKNDIVRVECISFEEPDDETMEEIRKKIRDKYPDKHLICTVKTDPTILGGVIVKAGNTEYDWSYEGKLRQLERILTGR